MSEGAEMATGGAVASNDDDFYDEMDDGDCPNCGGEGFVWDCIDGMCLDAEIGCDLCTRVCDWCGQ